VIKPGRRKKFVSCPTEGKGGWTEGKEKQQSGERSRVTCKRNAVVTKGS